MEEENVIYLRNVVLTNFAFENISLLAKLSDLTNFKSLLSNCLSLEYDWMPSVGSNISSNHF